MRKIILASMLAVLCFYSKAQVLPNIDWVQYYSENNTMDNIPNTLDGNKNVYVAGYTHNGMDRDINIVKYDSLGNMLWANSYGTTSGDDEIKSIKVNSAGDVFVTGYTYNSGQLDIFTAMYNNAGTQQWVDVFDKSGLDDIGIEITYDANYVYVFATTNNGSDKDATVIRYTLAGSLDYLTDYTGNGLDDEAVGFALTQNGDVACVANSFNGTIYEVHGYALDPSGNQAGHNIFVGSGSGDNKAKDLIVDHNDDVVICGYMNNSSTNDDYFTLKCDINFNAYWQMDYDDGSHGYEYSTSLVCDSANNIAVTGYVSNGGIYEYHTLCYDPSGSQLWLNAENTAIAGLYIEPRIVCDTIAHHFYVSGAKANISNDICVYQIAPTGNTKWKREFDGPANGHDASTGVMVTGTGVVFLSALTTNTNSGFDVTTIKISQTPEYYPIDPNNVNDSCSHAHYFYPNVGEILDLSNNPVANVLFSTKNTYPQQFILSNNNMAFLLAHMDTANVNPANFVDSLHRVDMEFYKGNRLTNAFATEYRSDAVLNYFLEHVSATPITDVKGTSRIIIPNIYPSIDLHYYSNSSGLKMYFVVKPGGVPSDIQMNFTGASTTTINGSNELVIGTTLGKFKFNQPLVYNVTSTALTTANATGTNIGWASVGGNNYKINTGSYITSLPLIIQVNQGPAITVSSPTDNVTYSSYIGGVGNEEIASSVTNNSGFVFYCGSTTSPNFPQGTGFQTPLQPNYVYGNRDGFIATTQNANLFYRTYVGGNKIDKCLDIDVDHPNNELYIVGITTSSMFPTKTFTASGAYNNSTFIGPVSTTLTNNDQDDGFIFQINTTLNNSQWCTYYGGGHFDRLSDCKLDANGNLFVIGASSSTNISVVATVPQYGQAYNTTQLSQVGTGGYVYDGIIMKFAASTRALNWATYYGSHSNTGTTRVSDDFLNDLDFDASGNVYVVGSCGGVNLPGKLNNNYNSTFSPDGIIAKFNNSGQLLFSKHTQGNTDNWSVKCKNNKVYMCGQNDANITTLNSGNYYYNGTNNNGGSPGDYEGNFIVYDQSFNAIHATYIGGNGHDKATDLQFDNHGLIYICGGSESTNFPIVGPANTYTSANSGQYDYFVMAIQEGNPNLLWSTQIGTNGIESGYGFNATMAIDQFTGLYLSGVTTSTVGYPVWNATNSYFQPASGGGYEDGTITRFWLDAVQLVGINENSKEAKPVSIYPNPTTDYLHLDDDKFDNKVVAYNVYNMIGQNVLSGSLDHQSNKNIDVSGLIYGTYLITFITENGNYYSKFVKIK